MRLLLEKKEKKREKKKEWFKNPTPVHMSSGMSQARGELRLMERGREITVSHDHHSGVLPENLEDLSYSEQMLPEFCPSDLY